MKTLRSEGFQSLLKAPFDKKKLNAQQLEQLKAQMLVQPFRSMESLRLWVEKKFNVQYSIPGIENLLEREFPVERRLVYRGKPRGAAQSGQSLNVTLEKVFEFLNSMPLDADKSDWTKNFRKALKALLPGAKNVAVELHMSASLSYVEKSGERLYVARIEHRSGDIRFPVPDMVLDVEEERTESKEHWLLKMLEENNAYDSRVEFAVLREYEHGRHNHIGTIVAIFKSETSARASEQILDRLQPFLMFCLISGIARFRDESPQKKDSMMLLTNFAKDHNLTQRERQVFFLYIYGESYEAIAREMKISVSTVNNHISSIRKKSGISKGVDLLKLFLD